MNSQELIDEILRNRSQIKLLEKKLLDHQSKYEEFYINGGCYTKEEVAEMVGKSSKTIGDYEKAGFLKAEYPMAKRRYKRQDVVNFMKEMRL